MTINQDDSNNSGQLILHLVFMVSAYLLLCPRDLITTQRVIM